MPSGKIQHLFLLTGEGAATPAGFASVITSGDYDIPLGLIEEEGIGDKVLTVLGLPAATVNFTATGVLKSELVKFNAPANGSAATALSAFGLITTTGEQYKLEAGAGSDLKVSIAQGENGRVQISGTMRFGKVTELSGTVTPVYLTSIGHQKKDATVTVDATAVVFDSIETGISSTLEPTRAAAGPVTAYDGWNCTESKPSLSLTTASLIETAANFLAGDAAGSPVPHDIVLTLDNGVVAENLTVTVSDMVIPNRKGAMDPKGVIWNSYEFTRGTGTISGRVVIS